jgi:hypothetical protein
MLCLHRRQSFGKKSADVQRAMLSSKATKAKPRFGHLQGAAQASMILLEKNVRAKRGTLTVNSSNLVI